MTIYNKFSKDFKDLHIKMNCWKKIAEKFKISITEAQNKFKNIRTAYGRFLKKKNVPSGSGRDAVPTARSLRSYGNRLIATIARIAGDYMETRLKIKTPQELNSIARFCIR